MKPLSPLPIDAILTDCIEALRSNSSAILIAPPGSGKTTRVAPHWVQTAAESIIGSRKTFLLQPRRVATRATAIRIADEQGWNLGDEVGYQVRFENRCKKSTKLIVATEGILLRRMQSDPILEDVGLVILDEFHERSLQADVLLGMLRRIQTTVRDDLRVLVMSATLESDSLRSYFDNAPVLQASGSLHPVDVSYRPPPSPRAWVDHVVDTILRTSSQTDGDILVFLPGVGEISRVQNSLKHDRNLSMFDILPLHGSLPLEEQTRCIQTGQRRRIVLSTNVAETSLTIEGVRCVIDSGMARVLRFDPQVGLDRLEMEPICKASATQRAGRAGRVAPGTCIRLWDQASQNSKPEYLEPEIRRIDLSGAVLQLMLWGEGDGRDFPWLNAPRKEAIDAAVALLERLGAIENGHPTELGKTLGQLSVSPRLARMLVEGHRRNCLAQVAMIAAMLSERDPFQRGTASNQNRPFTKIAHRWDSDVLERFNSVDHYLKTGADETPFGQIHRGGIRTIQDVAKRLESETKDAIREQQSLAGASCYGNDDWEIAVMKCLLAGFPDRLAKRRSPEKPKALMVGGKGVQVGPASGVESPELFVCIDVEASGTDANVRQASRVDESWLAEESLGLSHLLVTRDELFFHPSQEMIAARRRRYFDDLLLSESPVSVSDPRAAAELLYASASNQLERVLPNDKGALESLRMRSQCLKEWAPEIEFPAIDDELLRRVLRQLCQGAKSFQELRSAAWIDWIQGEWNSDQRAILDREVPERIEVPSGNRIRIQYEVGKPPILAVRIQEIFKWKQVPRLAFGRVPILLHLLAPNMRPQQVTDDLASFWLNTYPVVRKELRRRYPKHSWPEDPQAG